ncbi:hypothetical protein A7A08_01296 [Methyloligella halotolerans]|uniref:Uncharacterized protein n=1 Tax=Methyloligella halotolerans TaxID=1177755 RepID=A0A1E2S0W0_9HYPH|nr:hypothetical protein [Methyloligella halotolerans]ODA68126.1 hypothetical protein A7A08_01296 [Methyloligella halotolerans]
MTYRFAVSATLLALLAAGPASAETLSIACQGTEYGKDYAFTLVYEGGSSGAIHADGHFGTFDLTATRAERSGETAAARSPTWSGSAAGGLPSLSCRTRPRWKRA